MSCSEEWKKFNYFKTWNDPDWMNHNRATRQQIFKKLKKDNPDMLFNPTVISFGTLACKTDKCPVQQGNNPMRYNEISATANVTAPKSDEAIQREYLLNRLQEAHYPKTRSMVVHFNLHINNTPKTYKELIDAIKKGKYTLDEKITKKIDSREDDDSDDCVYYDGPFYGIVWDGPQPDPKGYRAALEDIEKMYQAAKDTIMVSDAAEGLKAIQKFEAWMPK